MKYMSFTKANCKNCYKCLRSCPVKAIKFKNNQAEIVEDMCIGCSHCLAICPQNARQIISDVDKVKIAINSGKKVIATLAPSLSGYFDYDENKIFSAIKALGFSYVKETAVGAEIVTNKYSEFINNNPQNAYITTACPSVIFLVQQYYPELVKYLMPVVSPMVAHGIALKSMYGEDSYVVFIGPCVAKKIETEVLDNKKIIDAVITIDELKQWIKDSQLSASELPQCNIACTDLSTGRKYPITNGIISGLKATISEKNLSYYTVTGTEDCMEIFSSISNGDLSNVVIEASSCKNSCVGGPTMIKSEYGYYKRLNKVKKFIQSNTISYDYVSKDTYDNLNFRRNFYAHPITKKQIDNDKIENILKEMGKYSIEDELNCGVCGYNTCREKAEAVYMGMAEIPMCLHFMRTKAESLSNVIFENSANCIMLLNKELKIIEVNPAFEKTFMVKKDVIKNKSVSVLMDETDFLMVLATESDITGKKVSIPKYNAIFIENIVYLSKQGILLASMFNIIDEEKNKNELQMLKESTLITTQDVIEKQMMVAQEIASLLGETTAETKLALSKLKKLVAGENGDR